MRMIRIAPAGLLIAGAVAALACSASANAATTITGSITFGGGGGNGYDPSTLTLSPDADFDYLDSYNHDTADFTSTSLSIGDQMFCCGALPWRQIFTASTPGYFSDVKLLGSTFTELSYQVSGDTLTLDWAGTYSQGLPYVGDYNATFSLGVPETSTWTMMILGVGGVGAALRRRRRAGLSPATAFR